MTYVKALELQGFKSFANKTVLKFPKAFNMIIGANGSGKSNIIDALCFVLGKASKKSMRAEKFSHLIFNGGKKDKPAKFASVKLTFDNSTKIFPYNTEEVSVSRTVRKDGASIYRINNNAVTRQEILNALNTVNLNPDGYNIILQGDIDRFVDLSPEQRRFIIEEISGISVYEDKKAKSLNELSKVEAKIKEASILLSEREKYLKELIDEKKQAENYLKMQEELRYKKGALLWRKMADCKESLESYDSNLKSFNEKIDYNQQQINEAQEKNDKAKSRLNEINNTLDVQGEANRRELAKELESLKIEENNLTNNIKNHENEIKRIESRLEQVNKELERTLESINKHQSLIKEFGANIEVKKASLDKKKDEYNLSDEVGYLKDRRKLQELESDLLKKKEQLITCSKAKEKEEELIKLKAKLIAEQDSLKQINEELADKSNKNTEIINKLNEVQSYIQHLNAEKMKIEAKLNSSAYNLSKGVNEVLKLKDKIKGVFGTISQLSFTDDKYSIALKVAAGNKMQAIITDDDESAKKCIEHLRDNKLGVASFIPLNKVNVQPVQLNRKGLGVIDLAVNLIKFDKKYEKAFHLIFGRTLVVHDLDTARRINYQGRAVTLDGDVVEPGGLMTGGYRHKESSQLLIGGYNKQLNELLPKLNTYKRYEAELIEAKSILSEEVINLREGKAKHESMLNEFLNKNEELKTESKGYEQYNNVESEIKELESRIKNFKLKLGKPIDESRISSVKLEIQSLTDEITKIEVEKRTLESELNNILLKEADNMKRILSDLDKEKKVFINELKDFNSRIKLVSKKIADKDKEEAKLNKQLKDLLVEKDKLRKSVESHEAKVTEFKDKIYSLKEKIQSINLERAGVSAKLEGLTQAFKDFEELKIESVKDSVKVLNDKINSLESSIKNFGPVNMKALEAFKEAKDNYDELKEKSDKLQNEKDKIMRVIENIESRKKGAFIKTFSDINGNFSRIFENLSPGGIARLELENKEDPFSGGVLVFARPRGKKLLTLKSMSGGEKTITALSFIFSIQEYNPAPFYIMDEVDAALDKINSEMLSRLLSSYSKIAQFIVISHNDDMISSADYLFGISMDPNGKSAVTSIKLP